MLLNKKRPALLICSTLIGSLLVGCSTTDEPASENFVMPTDRELLLNGQFANDDDWWVAGAGLKVKDAEACINITNPGSKSWDVILGQGGFGLIKGQTYTLEFNARADVETTFKALIQHQGEPYTTYFSKNINVTNRSAPFTYTFTHLKNSDANTDFQMQLGAQKPATVCFRNISLKIN
jgi:endoglucanase